MNLWRGTFSMTRPDLKMFDLLRENVFLKLPAHLYMVFLVNCETAKNPRGVDNIIDVAERFIMSLSVEFPGPAFLGFGQ